VQFTHEQVCRVTGLDGDPAALGGAVTVALCGNWEHDGPCRWPHHTDTLEQGGEVIATVRFDAPTHEVETVRAAIVGAMAVGLLTGPDGRVTRWCP
jgi:hypothetical protein